MSTTFTPRPSKGRSGALRFGFAVVAAIAACVASFSSPNRIAASSPRAVRELPGSIDTVIADPANVMYHYGPSEAERFSLQAEAAFSSNITVTYDAGFMANPAAQAAFQAAVDIWRSIIVSPAPIRVNASYVALGAGILGSAGPSRLCTGVGVPNTAYAAALADKINGGAFCAALNPPLTSEINASFSSAFPNWDFGTSGVPVAGKYNFLTVVMHELGHGLGFFGSMTASGGVGSFGHGVNIPDIYDRFAVTGAAAPLIGFVNPSVALGSQLVSSDTFFNGTNARANNGSVSPKLDTHFFPSPPADNGFQQGSSYSHLDDLLYTATANGLMTYALGTGEVYTDPGPIVRGIFMDSGWTITSPATAPSITAHPSSQTIASGATAMMSVSATGTAPLTYQWYVGASGSTASPIGGATSSTYTTPALTTTTSYWVRVSNGAGMADSNTATITVVTPPMITGQPANQIVRPGQSAMFVVAASGTAPAFKWQVSSNGGGSWSDLSNGAPYSGVTTTTLTVTGVTAGLNGLRYRAVASNMAGTATSNSALLTVRRGDARSDYDADARTDIAVYRPSSGGWYVLQSNGNYTTYFSSTWGIDGDIPVTGDYDGDSRTDLAVYRPSNGGWMVLPSSTNYMTPVSTSWGSSEDVPVPGDYDGDGKTDLAIYRPSTGVWWVLQSSANYTTYTSFSWGAGSDIPVPGDYDGDGKTDVAIYRPSTGGWWILQSSSNYTTYTSASWGAGSDVPVPGDYDGDGKLDVAVYRPSTGTWFVLQSNAGYTTYFSASWGASDDTPLVGDFDGDGKTDLAVYRPSSGTWYILQSDAGYTTYFSAAWGTSTDVPLPKRPS